MVVFVAFAVGPLGRTALLDVERKTCDREQVVVPEVRDDLVRKGCISSVPNLHVTVSGAEEAGRDS